MISQNNNYANVKFLVNLPVYLLTFYEQRVAAGFPSPAEEYLEKQIDLIKMLILHPSATYLVRAQGRSMEGVGIYDGDILIVDRSIKPVSGKIVVAAVDGGLVVKRLIILNNRCFLHSANPSYEPLEIREGADLQVWGVVTKVVHDL